MADITFNCPHCQQPVQCDSQWGGQQIQCPLCQGAFLVPQGANPPAPPAGSSSQGKQLVTPPAENKLAFQHNAQKPATPGRNVPIRKLVDSGPKKKKSPLVGLVVGAVVVVAVAGGGYFGWTKYQERAEAKKAEEARKAEAEAKAAKEREQAQAAQSAAPGTPAPNTPITPPEYTLEVTGAKIPQCAVNGTIAGTNFVAEVVRIEGVGPAQAPVLRLTQGDPSRPDRELVIYLGLKSGEKLSGHTWNISADMKGAGVPQVIKRWTVKAGYAPAVKAFATGYALQLEFGQWANGAVPGKIYVALPDKEQTVAGGVFQAATTLPDVFTLAPQPAAATAPARSAPLGGDPRYAPTTRRR